jgi:hypothetical protein
VSAPDVLIAIAGFAVAVFAARSHLGRDDVSGGSLGRSSPRSQLV